MTERNGWHMLVIPAIAPEDQTYAIGPGPRDVYHRRQGDVLLPDREPRAVLDEMRRAVGSRTFAAQYQQDPVPAEGNVIKREWIKYYREEPEFDRLVLSWDLASTIEETSSFSVGQLWGAVGANYYLLEVIRGRYEAPELRHKIIWAMREWQPHTTVIETTELARSLVQEIHRTTDLRPQLRPPRHDKLARLLAQSARFEAGQVRLPHDAPWLDVYLSELLAFPIGRHDDQVDATSLALYTLTEQSARERPLSRRNPTRR